ncbi:5652_t:CDS:2, partial [Dentiscutata heterogama]
VSDSCYDSSNCWLTPTSTTVQEASNASEYCKSSEHNLTGKALILRKRDLQVMQLKSEKPCVL